MNLHKQFLNQYLFITHSRLTPKCSTESLILLLPHKKKHLVNFNKYSFPLSERKITSRDAKPWHNKDIYQHTKKRKTILSFFYNAALAKFYIIKINFDVLLPTFHKEYKGFSLFSYKCLAEEILALWTESLDYIPRQKQTSLGFVIV